MAHHFFRHASLVAAALALLSGGALAAPLVVGDPVNGQFTLAASYAMPNGGTPTNGMQVEPPWVNNRGARFYLDTQQGGNSVVFNTYGVADNYNSFFGARVSGSGSFSASTSIRYSRTFTNTTGVAQHFYFLFHVDDGENSIYGNGLGFSDLLLQVSKNGTTIARDRTTRHQDANGNQSCVSDDLGSLGSYMDCANSHASGANFSLSLGMLEIGESLTLDYDIVATISGDLVGGGYGDCPALTRGAGKQIAPTLIDCGRGNGVTARAGDPTDYGNLANFHISPTAYIPEPNSLALLGLSLAGLATTTRRRKAGCTPQAD